MEERSQFTNGLRYFDLIVYEYHVKQFQSICSLQQIGD